MQTRTPRTILAVSAVLALAAASIAPTAAFARGPGAGAADCDGDCTNDQPGVEQPMRARDGSGLNVDDTAETRGGRGGRGQATKTKGRANAGGGQNVQTRPGKGATEDGYGHRNQSDDPEAGRGRVDDGTHGPENCEECEYEMGTLTDEQREEVLFMANEEKLAHDVYIALADVYDVPVFERIAWSENKHQTAVDHLMETYEIAGSPLDLEAGVFTNDVIKSLYDQLVAEGSESLQAAYGVGVQIEELDIADLKAAMVGLEEAAPDAFHVYSNLLRGSERHLTSFQRGA
jgi:hypothetical protein